MTAFIISLFFGIFQAFLLKKLLVSITAGESKMVVGVFFLKFLLYGIAAALLMGIFFREITYCLSGFAVGMPLTAIALFVYHAYFKDR